MKTKQPTTVKIIYLITGSGGGSSAFRWVPSTECLDVAAEITRAGHLVWKMIQKTSPRGRVLDYAEDPFVIHSTEYLDG
jgi:hypothetical protein